jgi:hypothetical protein
VHRDRLFRAGTAARSRGGERVIKATGNPWLPALLACVAVNAPAATPGDYAWTFPLATAGDSSAWQVELTPEVYARARDPQLRDVAVFNAEGRPVPVASFVPDPGRVTRVDLPALALPPEIANRADPDLQLAIERDARGRLRRIDASEAPREPATPSPRDWLLDAGGVTGSIDELVIDWRTPATGVVARFAIDAGDDLRHWHAVAEGQLLSLERQGQRLVRHDVALPATRAKYFRLRRRDDGAALDGLAVRARVVEQEGNRPLQRRWIPAAAAPDDGEPVPAGIERYSYALPSALPVEALRVELATDNALAPLRIGVRSRNRQGVAAWTTTSLTAFRLLQNGSVIANGDVERTPPERVREFRVDALVPLAAVPRLAIGYRPDRLVFLAEDRGPYMLAVGSARARRPDYPVDAAVASLRRSLGADWQPPLATIGAGLVAGGEAALTPAPEPIAWKTWLLWIVLAAGAALVAGLALALLRDRR